MFDFDNAKFIEGYKQRFGPVTADLAAAIEEVARDDKTRFTGFWLEAPREHMARRIETRRGDPSDATPDVLDLQMEKGSAPEQWRKLNAAQEPGVIAAEALATLT